LADNICFKINLYIELISSIKYDKKLSPRVFSLIHYDSRMRSLSLCIYLPSFRRRFLSLIHCNSRMRSLSLSLSMHIPTIFSDALSLALNRTISSIIIDRLLIKGRGGLVPISDKGKQKRTDLEVTNR